MCCGGECTSRQPNCCCLSDRCCGGNAGRLRLRCQRSCCSGLLISSAWIASLASFLIGLGFLIALVRDGRKENVDAFNAAAAAWPARAAAFSGLAVSVSGAGGVLTLPAVTAPDYYPDSDGLNAPAVNMRYHADATGSTPISVPSPLAFSGGLKAALTVSVNGVASPYTATLFRSETKCCGDKCASQCTSYFRLSGLCFAADDADGFKLAGGCGAESKPGSPNPATFASMAQSDRTSFDIPVDVRSTADPYVTAMVTTSGSLFFGVSQRLKVSIGASMFVIGALLLSFIHLCVSRMESPDGRVFSNTVVVAPGGVVVSEAGGPQPYAGFEAPAPASYYYGGSAKAAAGRPEGLSIS